MGVGGGGGDWGIPLYILYRYVPPQRVWFLQRFGLKNGYRLYLFSSGIVYSFLGSYIWECINACAFVVSIPNE